MTIVEFLEARIAEDEAIARGMPFESQWTAHPDETGQPITAGGARIATCAESVMEHISRHCPARVLAECEAKRRIVEQLQRNVHGAPQGWIDRILEHLAVVYVDHPDYREAWRA